MPSGPKSIIPASAKAPLPPSRCQPTTTPGRIAPGQFGCPGLGAAGRAGSSSGCEVAGDVEDELAALAGRALVDEADVARVERRHDTVGPGVADREVDRRGR